MYLSHLWALDEPMRVDSCPNAEHAMKNMDVNKTRWFFHLSVLVWRGLGNARRLQDTCPDWNKTLWSQFDFTEHRTLNTATSSEFIDPLVVHEYLHENYIAVWKVNVIQKAVWDQRMQNRLEQFVPKTKIPCDPPNVGQKTKRITSRSHFS